MSQSTPQGCLPAILKLFGITLPATLSSPALPYRLRDDFLSKAEVSFYRVLQQVVSPDETVFTKVNLGDLFFVVRPRENPGARAKIDRKHVDFLVCSRSDARPLYAIELDDASHQRAERIERDQFVDAVFQQAGLPLFRIRAARNYDMRELRQLLSPSAPPITPPITQPTPPPIPRSAPSLPNTEGPPVCRKCGVPMKQRQRSRGPNRGEPFWGCANHPRCREVVAIK